jgi:uncharacterized protein with von Willebrand factor type A (vWA) domain
MQLGDARAGKLADNISAFGRSLRRAGVRVDSAQIALAQQAALWVGMKSKEDLSAALESVLRQRRAEPAPPTCERGLVTTKEPGAAG